MSIILAEISQIGLKNYLVIIGRPIPGNVAKPCDRPAPENFTSWIFAHVGVRNRLIDGWSIFTLYIYCVMTYALCCFWFFYSHLLFVYCVTNKILFVCCLFLHLEEPYLQRRRALMRSAVALLRYESWIVSLSQIACCGLTASVWSMWESSISL